MPPIRLANADAALPERLVRGLAYPVGGTALLTCAGLALAHYLTLLGTLGIIASIVIWIMTWGYAIDCMFQTAEGYADPPEISLPDRAGNRRAILAINVLAIVLLYLVRLLAPGALLACMAALAVVLPAIEMSLAFDGSPLAALNPATWMQIVARFGAAYLIPVVAGIALALLIGLAGAATARLPGVFAVPLFGFAYTYLTILQFHWMGLLIWHYRERLGMRPEAPERAKATGQGADDDLVRECETQARTDPEAAAIRLRDRIRERAAPAPVHMLFRVLLRKLQRTDLLLSHAQTWIAQLCANNDARRALGLVQECREMDAGFVPDDPDATAMLARLASRTGMRDMASHLASGFAARWPRHQAAEELGRLAASLDRIA